ncbi:MAG: type III pantothenate kinase [Chloroflexaceae bacterium]|nr:type III pantothenate kinase [Chloroflexaceae bacterium]
MLLTVDIGNTNIKLGVYDHDTLVAYWRIVTDRCKLADEYAVLVHNLLKMSHLDMSSLRGCVISCVVPPLTSQFRDLAQRYLQVEPIVLGLHVETGLRYLVDTPNELGADRIANSLAAYHLVQGPVIAIALGTATAFDVVNGQGEYIGGAIAPGISISAEALFRSAARLYQVELIRPPQVIGKNTVHYIQSGLILGYAGLVEGLVKRMQTELGEPCTVVATGGLAEVIAQETQSITHVEPYLTLEGLRLIYTMNTNQPRWHTNGTKRQAIEVNGECYSAA